MNTSQLTVLLTTTSCDYDDHDDDDEVIVSLMKRRGVMQSSPCQGRGFGLLLYSSRRINYVARAPTTSSMTRSRSA